MRFFTSVHILLLLYVVVALVFWEFSLQRQSTRIYEQDLAILQRGTDSNATPAIYSTRLGEIRTDHAKRTKQYVGEGATFLIVILIGAFVVYKSFQRRIMLSKQQNNFMLSVTHELKTPIAGIKLNLQTLEKHKLDEEKRKLLLERCIRESNRLNDLCNNMLYASRIEGGQYAPAREDLDLSQLAIECYQDYLVRFPGRIRQVVTQDCRTTGDKMMLQIVINNLLENAMKYTPPDKQVVLQLSKEKGKCVIQVQDEGTGVPDSEKNKIFSKFYRIGNEESRKTKGTGLGLYLSKKIIQQHHGEIAIKDNQPTGAIFEVTLASA